MRAYVNEHLNVLVAVGLSEIVFVIVQLGMNVILNMITSTNTHMHVHVAVDAAAYVSVHFFC